MNSIPFKLVMLWQGKQHTLTLSNKRQETGGLHSALKLAVGTRVMLITNVDVSDGLVNGARGEVVHVVTNADNKVTEVSVSCIPCKRIVGMFNNYL